MRLEDNAQYKPVLTLIHQGMTIMEVAKQLGIHHGVPRRVFIKECQRLGAKYDRSIRIRDGQILHADIPLKKIHVPRVRKTEGTPLEFASDSETTRMRTYELRIGATPVLGVLGGNPEHFAHEYLGFIWEDELGRQNWRIFYPKRSDISQRIEGGETIEEVLFYAANAAIAGKWQDRGALPMEVAA